MTARTKRLFSASQPAGNWEAFFGYLITSTKEVMGLVWFGCTKKKKGFAWTFFTNGAADLDLDPGTFERTLHHGEIGYKDAQISQYLYNHMSD